MNLLLIDAGNTRIKLGLHDAHDWVWQCAIAHESAAQWPQLPPNTRALGVCVASAEVAARIEAVCATHGVSVRWLSAAASAAGLVNDYERPAQLGADRWAAAVGGWQRQRGACLIVNAGTATTLDLLSADGHFLGGCILPGFEMMRSALARGTAALPLAGGVAGPALVPYPRNTDAAILSGCLHAQLGAIERMRRQLPAAAPVLLTGGAAAWLEAELAAPCIMAPALVLEGLLALARAD